MKEPFHKSMELPLRFESQGCRSELRYSTEDPHMVALTIHAGSNVVPWEFARELLRDGRTQLVGDGDVQVEPDIEPSRVLITLTAKGGNSLTFSASKDLVTIFVTRIYTAVPEGAEHEWIDFDAEIAALLEEA